MFIINTVSYPNSLSPRVPLEALIAPGMGISEPFALRSSALVSLSPATVTGVWEPSPIIVTCENNTSLSSHNIHRLFSVTINK